MTQLIRKNTLLNKLLLSDGLPGCGKTMLAPILSAMDRVELLNYNTTIENICELHHLGKIDINTAKVLLQIETDEKIYESMMSRRVNFRPSDLSSVFRDSDYYKYLKRLFMKGDEIIIERIKEEKPILHYSTHMKLAFAEPIFYALGDKAAFIEVVRHPLYMVIQQTLNIKNSRGTSRNFHVYFKYNQDQLPWHINGWEDLYDSLNPVERSIYEIFNVTNLTEKKKNEFRKKYRANILTIPFESFVLDPWPYMVQIQKFLDIKVNNKTKKMMKKQRVPRVRISDGIPLEIYKRCGWKPPEKDLSERDELIKRREFVIKEGAGKESIKILDRICNDYETKYHNFE